MGLGAVYPACGRGEVSGLLPGILSQPPASLLSHVTFRITWLVVWSPLNAGLSESGSPGRRPSFSEQPLGGRPGT